MMLAVLAVSVAVLLAAALHDAAFRTVPNLFAAALSVCGLFLRAEQGEMVLGTVAAVMVFVAGTVCWRRGWMGGGDVKLLAAAALLVPPPQVPMMLAFVTIAGGILALPYLAARRRLARGAPFRPALLLPRILRAERWRLGRGGPLPYAVAILAGVGATIVGAAP